MIDIYNPTFDKSKVVVYVVGRISGDPNFKTKFEYVYQFLKHHGYEKVIVPTCVADNLPYERYAPISLGFVQACDVVYALSDWKDSTGAKAEVAYAKMAGKIVLFEEDYL